MLVASSPCLVPNTTVHPVFFMWLIKIIAYKTTLSASRMGLTLEGPSFF